MPPIEKMNSKGTNPPEGLQVVLVGLQDDGRALYVAQPEAAEAVPIKTPTDTFEESKPVESSPDTFGNPVALKEYAARVQALKAAQRFEQYVAQPGDTLDKVLGEAGYSRAEMQNKGLIEQVSRDSGLANPNLISPGRVLKIPVRGSATAQTAAEKPYIPYNPVSRPFGPIAIPDPQVLMQFAS